MKEVRWGMIGCGNVTEVKSGPAFQKAKLSKLVAVMCRHADKAKDYVRRHGVSRWYTSADELIHDPEINAVYIATPPDSHKDYTLLAAGAGKAVYVEKPMARCYDECKEMIEACNSAGIPLFVAYYRRSLPRFKKVKDIIDSGLLGRISLVSVALYQPPQPDDYNQNNLPWRVVPEISGGGRFVDLATHTLDILDYYFGPIENVTGKSENFAGLYPAEDTVSAVFHFQNSIIGTGAWCFNSPIEKDMIEIIGSKAALRFSTFGVQSIELIDSASQQKWDIENPRHIQQPHIQSVVDALTGRGSCPSDGRSAARTSQVIDWILDAWRREHQISFKTT